MEDRMKALGDFLFAALQHCEMYLDPKTFNPHAQFNVHSEIFARHVQLQSAYDRYRAEVNKSVTE